MIIKFGEVEIKVVRKEFFCNHCDSYDSCNPNHRSGLFFLCELGDDYFIIGNGESGTTIFSEFIDYDNPAYLGMSGCKTGDGWHMTCGGWISISGIVVRKIAEVGRINEEAEISLKERILLLRLLEQKANKVVALDGFDLNKDWGTWEHKKVLKKYFLRNKRYDLYDGAQLIEIGKSYGADFKWNNWRIRVPKPRKVEWISMYSLDNDDPFAFCVKDIVKNWAIFWSSKNNRKVLYYTFDYKGMVEKRGILIELMQYKDIVYPKRKISIPKEEGWREFIEILFTRKLGEVLFLKEKPEWGEVLNLDDSRLEKVIRSDNKIIYPDYGILILSKDTIPVAVPYIDDKFTGGKTNE